MFGPKRTSLERLSRTQDPTKGQINFFHDSLRPKNRSQVASRFTRTHASVYIVSCVGFVSRCVLEGGMHMHMFWHAPKITQPSHRSPGSAMSAESSVGNVTNIAAKKRQPW